MTSLVKAIFLAAFMCPVTLAADCAGGLCAEERDEVNFVQVKQTLKQGSNRSGDEIWTATVAKDVIDSIEWCLTEKTHGLTGESIVAGSPVAMASNGKPLKERCEALPGKKCLFVVHAGCASNYLGCREGNFNDADVWSPIGEVLDGWGQVECKQTAEHKEVDIWTLNREWLDVMGLGEVQNWDEQFTTVLEGKFVKLATLTCEQSMREKLALVHGLRGMTGDRFNFKNTDFQDMKCLQRGLSEAGKAAYALPAEETKYQLKGSDEQFEATTAEMIRLFGADEGVAKC